jgi:uncharacterized protein YjbJ (UPF0337 family)
VIWWNGLTGGLFSPGPEKETHMAIDKDRTEGSFDQAKGSVKETAGKLTGDSKLESEGKADKLGGKIQNAIGGIKDAIKGK